MQPLHIVNDVGFKNLLRFLEQGYEVPSRTHLGAVIKKRYVETRKELTGLLQLQAPAIALTMDAWTSKVVQSFQTFTRHFVNEWKLETSHFGGSHTARRIADKACEAVARVRASQKVLCIVQDEAANAVAAGRLQEEDKSWSSKTCAPHKLQTCIHHAIDGSAPARCLLATSRKLQ